MSSTQRVRQRIAEINGILNEATLQPGIKEYINKRARETANMASIPGANKDYLAGILYGFALSMVETVTDEFKKGFLG